MTSDDSNPADWDRLLRAARQNEWTLLGAATVVLAASFLLECTLDGHVRTSAVSVELPDVCLWHRFSGLPCPGCGLTRCFISLAHGNVAAAWHYHPFGVVLFAAVLGQLPYRVFRLRQLAQGRYPTTHPWTATCLWLLAAGLIGQWLLRMSGLLHS